MASKKKYWKAEIELQEGNPVVDQLRADEFTEKLPVEGFMGDQEKLQASQPSRRDFLKYLGFSTAAATMAACEGPVKKSIPYVVQPNDVIPGIANYYATSIADGYDFANVLVRTREGRPIKIERNRVEGSLGAVNARVNASVLTLYDRYRLQGPMKGQGVADWDQVDREVMAKLSQLRGGGKKVVLLTRTYASPSMDKLIGEFLEANPNASHVTYDAISEDAALTAYQELYGERALADYDFSKADLIVSFDADFLADWQGGGYDAGYASTRIPQHGKMSRHIQFESNMTLTGSNADKRVPLKPGQLKTALAKLFGKLNGSAIGGGSDSVVDGYVEGLYAEIRKAGTRAVVVCGIDDKDAQAVTLAINNIIQSEAFDPVKPRYIRKGSQDDMLRLMSDMESGQVGLLLMDGVNPVYSLADGEKFKDLLSSVDLSLSMAFSYDETAQSSTYAGAASHSLESWGDLQIKKGIYSLMQPVIRELFDTRQFATCLLKWMGSEQSYYEYVKAHWEEGVLNGSSWNKTLQDGVMVSSSTDEAELSTEDTPEEDGAADGMRILTASVNSLMGATDSPATLVLYSKVGMGDGQQANNPWLQEFPDPISRVSWDNYLTVSKSDAEELGLQNTYASNGGMDGKYVRLKVDGVILEEVPVVVQPGQAKGTFGLALGYGRQAGLQEEMRTGVNAFRLYKNFGRVQDVQVEKVGGTHEFASVQLHKTLMGRGDIIKEATLSEYNTEDSSVWNPVPQVSLDHQEVPAVTVDLWESFDRSIGHHFNMSIDLNACTGCGACVIACHAENNVPVVGKHEIRVSRDMHWLRIDRYYSSEDTFAEDVERKDNLSGLFGENGSLQGFGALEDPAENPQVAFQPVMCQHCNHAPCETVCPVAATSHSRQGHNHMVYNRCIGTRYCANNCPYKVRRFNWFEYSKNDEFDFNMNNDLGRMVLNPDVTVRSRGVMEKCSFCIQRTQSAILEAKKDGREVKDHEFETACSSACSTGAIVFGDINDEHSEVSELKKSDRMYHLLEHVGTQPNVFYQVKVRNTEEA